MGVLNLKRAIVSVSSLDLALLLYRDALGLIELNRQDGVVTLQVGAGDFQLVLHERPPTPSPAGVALSFRVDDLETVVQVGEKAGATVLDPPALQPWGERQAVLSDTDGHIFCLVSEA
jgi:predicted enzyme related to lactoylglutathione lyase